MSDTLSSGAGPDPERAEGIPSDADVHEDDAVVENDPATDDSVSDVLPEGTVEPDPPVGLP